MKYLVTAIIAFLGYSMWIPETNPIEEFVQSLSSEQKELALFPFENEERKSWHFLPAASSPRSGIQLSALTEEQKLLVHEILKSVLSEKGYNKSKAIIDLENILAELENNYTHRDPDQYAIAIFGKPKGSEPWSWSFGGHHISLHFTYVDGQLSTTPRFFGANPGEVRDGPKTGLRVLGREEDLGLLLLHSLDAQQRVKAIISEEPYWEIVTRNDSEVGPLEFEGISKKELQQEQREIMDELISEYLGSLNETLASKRKALINAENIRFGWAGATELGKPHYYRIQGETFLIEFDNAQNEANHVHTVWRDFDGDFGRDLIREHRKAHKH